MMKKHKRRCRIGLALLLLCLGALTVYGAAADQALGNRRVYDQAGLFSESQSQELESRIQVLKQDMNMDVVVVTAADAGGKSAVAYADDFYDYGGFGNHDDFSGVLFLIDMDNREITVSTTGAMRRFLTDDRIEAMLDHGYGYVQDGDYAGAAGKFLEDMSYYYQKGIPGNQYLYDTETGKVSRYHSIRWYELLLALAVSVFCGGVACLNVRREYAMKGEQKRAAAYHMAYRANAQFRFGNQQDHLANSFVTQRIIQRSTGGGGGGGFGGSSSGRSSTHTGSSGRSHGGGSRKF